MPMGENTMVNTGENHNEPATDSIYDTFWQYVFVPSSFLPSELMPTTAREGNVWGKKVSSHVLPSFFI